MINHFKNLQIQKIYSPKEVMEIIEIEKMSPPNPAAYTYNRINEGMTKIQPFFEHIHRGEYKYLGPPKISKYTGIVLHHPKEDTVPYQVGAWKEGEFSFLDTNIKDIKSWIEQGRKGVKVIVINSKVLLKMNGLERKYSIQVTNEKGVLDNLGGLIISHSSKLGSLLLGKREGDKFLFGENKIEIIKIYS